MVSSERSRWALLFADLEAQLAAGEAAEREGAVAELTRAEQAAVRWTDRLRATRGPVRVELSDGEVLEGRVAHLADTWMQLDAGGTRGRVQHVVPVAVVAGIVGLGSQALASQARTDRLGLGTALRALQRDRARVQVRTTSGQVVGRIARVGADHLDVVEVDRARPVDRVVPFSALLRVSEA
ncbi:hypothetical protein [Isoptericola sediminis]|uniref:Fis family transcriptional regulator n=1 Tax=Isoptericola sediminis TaxID=2733572 RepID=A0A849K757_9MICO|nr:hypothetical protein [Isoptericola sediminis]NNU27859.1 hypothetical protein [Isoptericola sediminis]